MHRSTPFISVITPIYGCASTLDQLYERLVHTLTQIDANFEIIMVNDASPDNAWEIIKKLAQCDLRVKGVNFSRNFGQHRAITAGLDYAQGDWIIVMDCDLQDQPEEILKLYRKAQEGYDIVVGKRIERKDNFFKKLSSHFFYKLYNYLTDAQIDKSIGNFGIYSKQVIKNVKLFREQNRSFGLFVLWTGFTRIEIEIKHAPRQEGTSSYTLSKLINLAIDSIVAHSNKPLKLSVQFGFILSFLSLLYSIWLVISYIFWSTPIIGWTSLIVSLYFLAGLIIGSIGMLGLYIGKIFDEVKQRPLYIIQETTFTKSTNET
ncbi:glycosyltransferase family 2 protein [Sulfurovum sp. ST-21]|uniref:Glycosyltransferase family 2 protein n=1 Tax=Sulfurovum indicum TaxID=2779528 RepID=A0A7M1S4C3_9BACT|nr:glycosyltransferase family 2 protein [Sulfurovum indicum]QOR62208.1 glycosyltransferase family 2 protein [Sulfurovum indicum]